MKLQLFKTLWGHTGGLEAAADQALAAGFDGLEGPIPGDAAERHLFAEIIRERGLLYIAEISTTGFANPTPGASVDDHIAAFERLLALSLQAGPIHCTTMAGSDLWTFAESLDFLARAHAIAQHHGIRVGFETHRSRSLYHPIVARDLLRELPGLELTMDFSHWCVVTERLVMDQLPDILALCARRVLHAHARVGYDQGPQVPDPRAPEYEQALLAHHRWWRALWDGRRQRHCAIVTMTPEFGPDGYLHLAPFTQHPAADLWELNSWMASDLRQQFAAYLAEAR